MKKIYWRVLGGLGNQLFEYAFIYALIKKENADPKIFSCMKHNKDEDEREFALSPFNISLKLNKKDRNRRLSYFSYLVFKRKVFSKKYKNLNTFEYAKKMVKKGLYHINHYIFIDLDKCPTKKNNILIEGYYQAYQYFDDYREDILREFKITSPISKKSSEVKSEIEAENSVCVHIRRGDYNKECFSRWLKLCEYDYYKQAMDYVNENTENPVFYVFSNNHSDVEWIKENYDFSNYNVKYVDLGNKDYEDLQLMISCKHFIISNSTYSWWAQYLSENENKIVVSPSKWRRNEKEKSQLIMPNFKLIDVE